MEIEPQHFFVDLIRFSKEEKRGPSESLRLVEILNRFLIEEQVNSSLIDLYLIHIFDKSYGLIHFINVIVKNKNFKNASTKSIEILYTLVNNFPSKLVESNTVDIYSLCINIIKSDASSDVKVKTLELLLVGLEKLDMYVESNDITSSYKLVLVCLENALKQKHSDTVKHKELIALGFFVKKYQYLVSNPKELQQLFVRHFDGEMVKPKKSQHVICGFFTGFSYYCESFPLNTNNDKTLIGKLYKFLQIMAVPIPTEKIKIGNRAALSFLSTNGHLFGEFLLKDYKFWHSKLLNWLEIGEDNRKVGVIALRAYFQTISTVLCEKTEGAWQPIVEYFNQWCIGILKKENATNHVKRLAIQCLRIFSNVSYKYLPHEDVTDLFLMVMQTFEYTYVLNYNPNSEEWEYLPYYVQTIANLMQFKTFTSSEFCCLQRAVINMIKSFHQLPYLHHDLVIDGIVTTCFYLKKTPYFDAFVENIIYQGVLWTCSHEHISKAEFSEETDEKIVTIKKFFPLWKGILKLSSNRGYDKYGMYLDDRKYILGRIVNQFVRTLMILINKLNLSVKLKEEEVVVTELEEAYQVEQTHDYAIFLNVTDLYQELLNNIDPEMFKKCICKIIKHIINKCVEFPLISGFYKLLSYGLKIANNLRLFEDENSENSQDVINSRETLTTFLEILLVKMIQYKDELLISCLQVLLECPVIVIKDMLSACVVPFLTIFNVGRSFLPLAEMGLNTLEYWQENIISNDLDLLLMEVVPSLDSYLRSKSLQGQTRTNISEKRRKTAQALKKRKVLVELEPELVKLQKKILSFIGKQNSKICEAFVYSENLNVSTIYRENLHLKVTLPYEDLYLDIHLDSFVLRVVNLALFCSDRKTRITACELLQAIVMVFLGRAKPMSQSGLSDLDDVLRAIAMPLLRLGCDIDQLVQQIFAPLFLQLIHWYTSPTQLRGAHTGIIVDVLMEGITHPTDSRLRDFSGKCVNEFVKWTIKQTNAINLSRDPINIKILVKKMRFFSSHPDPAKKLGSALIFNNIYREIREEETLISIFWIDVLHIFVTSLSLIEYDFSENDIVIIQIKNAVGHLQRVFVEKPELFRILDDKRRVPSDIGGGYMKDVAVWLFKHTGNKSRSCREVCMELFITISPLMEKRINLPTFIKENFTETYVSNIYEIFISTYPTPGDISCSEDCTILLKWMQGLLSMLDGYNFVIKNNLGDVDFTNNQSFVAIDYFLENIHNVDLATALNLIKHKSWIFTSLDREQFNKQKSVCILSVLKLYNSIINNEVLCKKADILWTKNFWRLILNAVFNPQLIGLYDRVTRPKHLELLIIMLNTLPRKISENKVFELVEVLHNYIEDNCFTSIDLTKNIPLVQRNLIRGLLLLNSTNLNKQLVVEKYTNGLVNELVQNFFTLQTNNVIFLNELQETTLEYCELILSFALTNHNEIKCLINHLYEKYMVQSMEFNKEVTFGIYFLNSFTEAIIRFILTDFDCFISMSKEHANMELTLELVVFILNYIKMHKSYKDRYSTISNTLLDNWSIFKNLFESSPEHKHLGIEYLKLLIPLCKSEPTDIHDWLIQQLLQEPDFNSKLQIFYLLVETTVDKDIESRSDLEDGLLNLSKYVISSVSSSDDKNSHIFHKMLTNTPNIKSAIILKFFIELYSNLSINVDMAPLIIKFVNNNDEMLQLCSLKLIYELCRTETVDFENRYKIIKNVVPTLFQICNISSFEKFFEHYINEIISTCEDNDKLPVHILHFVLIEILFLRIPIGTPERTECSISSAANKPKLLQFFVKYALDAFKNCSKTSDALLRLYKCHAYNTLASIVSNSLKSKNFYEKLFIRQEDNNDILWSGIIDRNKTYDFPISFESIPSQRKVLLNIRDEIMAHQKNIEGKSRSVNYIESQRLFNSSLTEDVTNFDFTNTMLRSQNQTTGEKNNSVNCQREIQLEEVNINDHECMATICGLIQHIFDSGVSELPREDEEVELPSWLRGIRTILLSEETHRNIKIFLVKLIDNMIHIFNYYAKWFLEPLLKFVVDKNAGDTTNYFVTDVIIILSKWATKIVALNERECKLASEVLDFLISNLKIDRLDIFKYNLDLIKLIVESWKTNIVVPVQTIFTLISAEGTSEIGIHLTSIFLVNKLSPWQENNREAFFKVLLKIMDSKKKSVYRPCSETVGLVLYYLKTDQCMQQVDTYLKKISDIDKYVYCLEGVAIHFPQIITAYHISKLICSLNQIGDTPKILHLKLIYRRVEISLDILEEISDFKIVEWNELLEHANLEIQIITLQIIKKCLTVFMNYKSYVQIVKTLARNVTNASALYRNCLYDIAILIYQQNKDDIDMCKEILIFGLVDHDADNRQKIIQFWTENANLPKPIINRFPYLLSNLYKTKIEDQFLGYINYFLISILSTSDKYNEEIFEHPLEDCDFEDYHLQTHWRLQHPSVVPLFAETLETYSANIESHDDSNLFQLRKTQTSFAFAPTESVHDKEFSKFISLESSLGVSVGESESAIKNPNDLVLSQKYRHRRRFLRDKSKISMNFAHFETKKQVKKVQQRFDMAKENERKVTIYRKYRRGDFPDIQILLSSVLLPLQMLSLHDSEVSKILFTEFFKGVASKAENNGLFNETVSNGIKYIFENSTYFNPNVFTTMLDILLKNKDKFQFEPQLICYACQQSGLISIGTLLLEEYLVSIDDQPSGSKRGPGTEENKETALWVKLAELYKELEEWDVVRSIFLEKMNCKDIFQKAIKYESEGQWQNSQDLYRELIDIDLSSERKDFYYESYFKCFANLGQWEYLPETIKSVVTSTETENVWDNLWDNGWCQQKLLPWYITAQVRDILFSQNWCQDFAEDINKTLSSAEKTEYLQTHFSEELCIMWMFKKDIPLANFYLQSYIKNFLGDWQLVNPLFSSLRYNKVLKLRNVMETDEFISVYSNLSDDFDVSLKKLTTRWQKTANELLPSVVLNETRLLYRTLFIKLLREKIKRFEFDDTSAATENLKSTKLNLDIAFIESASEMNNYYMPRKYFKKYATSKDLNVMLACGNIVFVKSKMMTNVQEELTVCFQALDIFSSVMEGTQDPFILLRANLKCFDIITRVSAVLKHDEEFFVKYKKKINTILKNEIKDVADIDRCVPKMLRSAIDNIKDDAMDCDQNEMSVVLENVAKGFVKLAHFTKNQNDDDLQGDFILYVLRAMKLNSLEAKQLFPCILMQSRLGTDYSRLFIVESEKIPTWMFLGWIPQLLANVDSKNIFAISKIIMRIAEAYPQAIMYPYRLSKENYSFNDPGVAQEAKYLINSLDKILLNDEMVDKFLKALSYISVPAVMLRYYVGKMQRSKNEDNVRSVCNSVIRDIFGETPRSGIVTSMQGNMFKNIGKFKKDFEAIMATKNQKQRDDLLKKLDNELKKMIEKDKCSVVLKDYCPWLANFSANKLNIALEIPGQYTGQKLPLPQHHVKISGFSTDVKVMSSLRKPIKITILGMDTKEYPFLVKFGEDIRQDQRIEQLFVLMNDIFKSDTNCINLDILTYQVIPLTYNLGVIQWINDTQALNEFVKNNSKNEKIGKEFQKIGEDYMKWLCRDQIITHVYGKSAVKYSRDKTIGYYRSLVNRIPWDVMRTSFWSLSIDTENYIALKNNFIKSYAILCTGQWILGIGDRHLGNSLICVKNGKVLGIDFGHAFGTATQILPVPELVPFRLTPHIISFMEPLRERGQFRESMIHCLRALRANHNSLLATMNVFIQEPSLDWLEHASKFENSVIEGTRDVWYPNVKVDQTKRKLEGASSTQILIEDLVAGQKIPQYTEAYIKLVKGTPEHDLRARFTDESLTVESQVDCLIDHATDYNLLGRMYAGWMPWV